MNSNNENQVISNNKDSSSSDLVDQSTLSRECSVTAESINNKNSNLKSTKKAEFNSVPHLNPIPSAYSWRVVPAGNYYSQQPPAPINTYQQQHWQHQQQQSQPNDPIYNNQYVQPSSTATIYPIDSNIDLQYDYATAPAYQNINYNYSAYNYSPHTVANNLTYSYDSNSQATTTSPSTSSSAINNNNTAQQYHHHHHHQHHLYYDDKISGISEANLAYHYIPNDHDGYNNHLNNITNNSNNNTIAQNTTDNNNNNYNNIYYSNQHYRKTHRYSDANKSTNGYTNTNSKQNKTDLNNNFKNKQDSKKQLNNKTVSKVSVSVDENLNRKNSDIVKPLSSVSPLVSQQQYQHTNSQAYNDYNNNNSMNHYSNSFYNTPYNQSHHFNHYSKSVNYKHEFYGQPQYLNDPNLEPANLEVNMANLNLVTYFPNNKQHFGNMLMNPKTNDGDDLYDPKEFYIYGEGEKIKKSRFFVIKSYSRDDVIHSIKNGIWCSTEEGNKKLDKAFNECATDATNASVYLFFSVNGSGHFCGIAEMMSRLDYESKSELWTQDKWQGTFEVKWIFVKDVPNVKLRHILLANNENKPVTNSRDTQEVFYDDALLVLDVFRTHIKKNSILDEYDSEIMFNQFNETAKNRFSWDRKNKYF